MSEECELNESHCYDYCNECSTCHICVNEWQVAGDDKIKSLEADNKTLLIEKDNLQNALGHIRQLKNGFEADNALLKSENTRYEKHNKNLKNELNIWNESTVTEKVRELTEKVKELEEEVRSSLFNSSI